MSLAIQPSKTSRIRAAAIQYPGLNEAGLAKILGIRTAEIRNALGREPMRRVKSVAK